MLTRSKALIVLVACGLAAAATSAAFYENSLYRVAHHAKSWRFRPPAGATESERRRYIESALNGTTPPSGWELLSDDGDVEAILTGLRDAQTDERQLIVRVRDDVADLESATLIVDGQVRFTATRANGAIVDRGGKSLATMTALVPAHPPCTVEARWTSSDNVVRSHAVHQH